MNKWLALLDALEAEFKAKLALIREMVQSERFLNLTPEEQSNLITMSLSKAFMDDGGAK